MAEEETSKNGVSRTKLSLLFSNGVRAKFYHRPVVISKFVQNQLKLNSTNAKFAQFTREFGIDQLALVKVLVGNSKVFLVMATSGRVDRPGLFSYIAERGMDSLLLWARYCSYANVIHSQTSIAGLTLLNCIDRGVDPTLYLLGLR
jgi:hypothetical protein